jgi:hypothetical protein
MLFFMRKSHKPLLVVLMQWFYLLLGVLLVVTAFYFQNLSFIPTLGIANEFILGFFGLLAGYCLVLFLSFFFQKTNLLIFALVLIFFSTIGSLAMLVISLPNAQALFSGDLPTCARNIATCNTSDGIAVAGTALLVVSVPLLLLNILTIIAAIKGIGAAD